MVTLENITGDMIGTEAIKALDRNIKAINAQGNIEISNNLTETVVGKALDATQGKTLKAQVDEIKSSYYSSKNIFAGDANTLAYNGIYRIIGTVTNIPASENYGILKVENTSYGNGNYLTQMFISIETGQIYTRYGIDNIYTSVWRNITSVSNPNLLINGDFQIWQRGTNFAVSGIYTADRWFVWSDDATSFTITKDPAGLKIGAKSTGSRIIEQRIERTDSLVKNVIGKPVTISIMVDSITYSKTVTLTNVWGYGESGLPGLTFEWVGDASGVCRVFAVFKTLKEHIISWTKMELGSTATPFIPRPYGEELALCQRYYEVSEGNSVYMSCDGTPRSFHYNFKVTKRIPPTCKVYDSLGNENRLSFVTTGYIGEHNKELYGGNPLGRVSSVEIDFIPLSGYLAVGYSKIIADAEL